MWIFIDDIFLILICTKFVTQIRVCIYDVLWLWCNITVIVQCQSRFQITLLTKTVKPKLGVHSCANLPCSCCTFSFRYGTFYRQQLLSNQFLLTWIVHDVSSIAVRIWYGYLKLPFIFILIRFNRLCGNVARIYLQVPYISFSKSFARWMNIFLVWNSMRNTFFSTLYSRMYWLSNILELIR